MSEWRIKRYYEHRVLIPTQDVLSNPYPDVLMCLTSGQVAIIRKLLEYATWRSTFVSEYHQQYYLSPDNEEWDSLQAVVSDLESRLTMCEEFATQLGRIADALACICGRMLVPSSSSTSGFTPITPTIIEGYIETGDLVYTDPYDGSLTPLSADRCAIANLAWASAFELLTEVLQPVQNAMIDYILPAAMTALATMIGGPILGLSTGTLLAILWDLLEVWAEGELQNVINAYYSYRQELVCAVYEGLATDVATAAAAAAAVIDGIPDFAPIDAALMKHLWGKMWLQKSADAWDNQTAWALGNYDHTSCSGCGIIEGTDWFAIAWGQGCTVEHPNLGYPYVADCEVAYTGMQASSRLIAVIWTANKDAGNDAGGADANVSCRTLEGSVYIDQGETQFFGYKRFEFDNQDCYDTLSPTATGYFVNNVLEGTGNVCFGWSVTGLPACTLNATIDYLVFKKPA